jgi:hypothetical protein
VSRSLHVPSIKRKDEGGRLWKVLPFLAAALIIGLIWAERRSSKRGNAQLGTAPAGAPPMREREPTTPTNARPAPFAAPGSTSGAAAGSGPAAAQPAPIAESDAPGTLPPDELASAGPDMETWVRANEGDTDSSGGADAPADAPTTADRGDNARADATSQSAPEEIPTPAAETTAVSGDEGKDWVQADGAKTCPEAFPIKGNATSRIYHLPGESTYEATIPEICFATEAAAIGLGYRARKR